MKETCARCKHGFEIMRGDYKCEIQEIKIPKFNALDLAKKCTFFVFKGTLVKIKKLNLQAQIPKHATAQSAGFDLHCIQKFDVRPGEHCTIGTGLAFEIPSGYAMFIYPRSGNAKKYGLTLSNAVGVVDADYRGEIKILIHNAGKNSVGFQAGDRIAQAIIHKLPDVELLECVELDETSRGTGGFGSTGK
ncbi:MAG: dUTP diphosphatase [Desulfotomaculum sp.]|nr:dUTP diphosphatase [Desulfotomaculum sp.]